MTASSLPRLPAPYYEQDGVTIYHGDALDIVPWIPPTIGAVVTDPPYSSGGAFRGDRTRATSDKYVATGTTAYRPEFAGDNRDQRAFMVWCSMWLKAAREVTVPGGVLCSFIDWRQLPVLTDSVQVAGWVWRNVGIWHKPGVRMQQGAMSSSAEFVVYATHGPQIPEDGKAVQNVIHADPAQYDLLDPDDPDDRPPMVYQSGVVRDREHIAQKPEAVMHWLLGLTTGPILDPFMGSGSTVRAALNLGRECIAMDTDERYCEIAARRLAQGSFDLGGV